MSHPLIDSASAPGETLDVFDGVCRGDNAPDWVHHAICSAWGLDPAADIRLIVLSENVTFRVTIDGRPSCVVRLARPGYGGGAAHARSELSWIEALKRDRSIPTPSPIRGVDGELVQFLGGTAGWMSVAFEFIDGTMLEDQAHFTDQFEQIGRLTASMHRHAQAWEVPEGFERFDWRVSDLVGPNARWGDWRAADLSDDQLAVLETAESRAIAALGESSCTEGDPGRFGLIHADLRPSNVMTGPGGLTVLDFDDCGYGFYLYDFAAALTFYEHTPQAPELAAQWMRGYRSIIEIDETDLVIATALSMIRRLTMLGWMVTHDESAVPAQLWAENLPGTVDVARRYLADPLWLVRP